MIEAELGTKIVTEEIRRAFDVSGSVTYIEIPIGVAGIPGWEFTWHCRRTDMYFRLAFDQEYSSVGLRNYVRAECVRLVSEAGRKATPGPRCDHCGKQYESYQGTVALNLPGKVFCGTECCSVQTAIHFCAECRTRKIRNDADTRVVCPKCEPEDCQYSAPLPTARADYREPGCPLVPIERLAVCQNGAVWEMVRATGGPVAWDKYDEHAASNYPDNFKPTNRNVGAFVQAGLRKLCFDFEKACRTARRLQDTIWNTVEREAEKIDIQIGEIKGGYTMMNPESLTLRAGHPDKRESSGKDEDEAVNDWFDRYDKPPPKDLCEQLSPRWQIICDMARDGYSRTEGVNRTKRIGEACSSHFLSWAFVATGCKTGGDRER